MYSGSIPASAVAAAAAARGASAMSSLASLNPTAMMGAMGIPVQNTVPLRCVDLVEQLRAEFEMVGRDTAILKAQRDELDRKREFACYFF